MSEQGYNSYCELCGKYKKRLVQNIMDNLLEEAKKENDDETEVYVVDFASIFKDTSLHSISPTELMYSKLLKDLPINEFLLIEERIIKEISNIYSTNILIGIDNNQTKYELVPKLMKRLDEMFKRFLRLAVTDPVEYILFEVVARRQFKPNDFE